MVKNDAINTFSYVFGQKVAGHMKGFLTNRCGKYTVINFGAEAAINSSGQDKTESP